MKAIIKNVGKKKIIGINTEEFAKELQEIAEMTDCEFELQENTCGEYTLEELCNEEKIQDTKNQSLINEQIVLFSGLGGKHLDRILNMMRINNVNVSLKAVVTQYNKNWTVSKLRDEIKKEHELMNGIDGGGQND